MRNVLASAVLCVLAGAAFGEEPAKRDIPPGAERVEAFENVVILTAEPKLLGPAAKLAFVKGAKEMYSCYKELYGFEGETVTPGVNGSVFKKPMDESLSIILFRDQATYDKWLGIEGTGGVTLHRSRMSRIGLPMTDGQVQDETWPILWHEMSHAFLFTVLRSGATLWLNEGLAEYFAFANKRVDPKGLKIFQGMIDRLKETKDKGTVTPLKSLFSPDGDFGRQQYDEAWVLMHLLMTEAKPALNAMLRHVRAMEDSARENPEAVMKDIHIYLERMVELTFKPCGGAQKAWEHHRDALLRSPSMPAKLPGTPASLKDEPAFLDLDGKLVHAPDEKDGSHVLVGDLVYGLPGPGKIGIGGIDPTGKLIVSLFEGASTADCKPVKMKKLSGSLTSGKKVVIYLLLESPSGAKYARKKEYTVPR